MAAFIDFAAASEKPVVDIGAAYGVATIPALSVGASVIAVDTDHRHLEILRTQLNAEGQARLTTLAASFPEDTNFENNSISAFLVARVLHFFSPDRLQLAAKKLFDWLVPGGKVFITGESPYLNNWKSFIPTYEFTKGRG
jgi:SAM-dependent methyltransferase